MMKMRNTMVYIFYKKKLSFKIPQFYLMTNNISSRPVSSLPLRCNGWRGALPVGWSLTWGGQYLGGPDAVWAAPGGQMETPCQRQSPLISTPIQQLSVWSCPYGFAFSGHFLELESQAIHSSVTGLAPLAGVFEVHPCSGTCWCFTPFHGCMIFHHVMGNVLFIYSTVDGHRFHTFAA